MQHVIVTSMLGLCLLIVSCSKKPVKSNGPPVDHLNYITWDTTAGTEMHDFETCVLADPYGGGVVAGGTEINPNSVFDAYLVFFDRDGSYFERTYFSPVALWIEGICALDDGFAVAGCYIEGGGIGDRAWISKFDWSGNIIWEMYYAGIQTAESYCITGTRDGNLVVGAFTFGDFVNEDSTGQYSRSEEAVLLVDGATGEVLKETRVTTDSFHVAFVDGIDSYDGGVAIVGWGIIKGSAGSYFMLLDDTLGVVKQTSPASCIDGYWASLMEVRWDGDGFIATGAYDIDGHGEGESQMMLIRFTRDGDIDWCRTFGEGMRTFAKSVAVTRTGYAAVGFIAEPEPIEIEMSASVYLVLTDKSGNTISEHKYRVTETTSDEGGGIDVTADGGLLISARTFVGPFAPGDIFVIKTDPHGNLLR